MSSKFHFYLLLFLFVLIIESLSKTVPSIPPDHLLCWFRNLPQITRKQLIDSCYILNNNDNNDEVRSDAIQNNIDNQKSTPFSTLCLIIQYHIRMQKQLPCWGYESDASQDCLLYKPECPSSALSWAPNKNEQINNFFTTADFGYVRERKNELTNYCKANITSNTELKCTNFLRYCTGRYIYIDFKRLTTLEEPIRYREDVLASGDIGGWNCLLDKAKLLAEGDHKGSLMSWFNELSNFEVRPDNNAHSCDITIDKPTFIMKLDSTVNMYHHFCDFVNLYASFHLNETFNRDNFILIWDTIPYRSNFAPAWKAFTINPILDLERFKGKKVCFKSVIFPLLPRMIFGLYYNMPLIPGCMQSGLFRAFNRHMLYNLGLASSEDQLEKNTLRVTFIQRNTRYRRVLNQDQMIDGLRQSISARYAQSLVQVQAVDFNELPFMEQVHISSQSDILIGMHGAGLTHTLFQPDYGVLFELYNCEDTECYKDLARLRGTHYLTWRDASKLEAIETDNSQAADRDKLGAAHAKFVNYRFDVDEFVHIVNEAIEVVRLRKKAFSQQHLIHWYHNNYYNVSYSTHTKNKVEL